jgi:glycosyltransferase involved in cell wall biosynthesis
MELYMARTARALVARHAVLAVIADGPSAVRPVLEEAGVPARAWRVGLAELPLLSARRLARLLDAEGVDALHVHSRRDLPLAALAKRFSRRKPRLVFHSQMKVSHPKTDPYHAFLYGQVDTLVVITAQLAGQWRARLPLRLRGRVQTLYYGAEPTRVLEPAEREALRREHGLPTGAFTVGLFGQKHEGKGQGLLVEALHWLRGQGIAGHALIVGPATDPAFLARLRARIGELGLTGHVTELDFVPRPQELMQLCDVVVLATWQETFGLVLIEAMGVGVPVIGSNAGGVPEIIEHGRSGLLFETRNAASLAEQLRTLHDDPALRALLAAEGQRVARERFAVARHYEALEAVLRGEPDGAGS